MAASRMLGSSLGGRAARCSPLCSCSHANAATGVRAAVSLTLTQMYHAAFTSAVNDGDAAPATTGSEEEDSRERTTMDEDPIGEDPVSRAAKKAADVAGKVRPAAEEVKEAGREAKDRVKEVAEDVVESVKKTRP